MEVIVVQPKLEQQLLNWYDTHRRYCHGEAPTPYAVLL